MEYRQGKHIFYEVKIMMFIVSIYSETFVPGESEPDRATIFKDEPMSLERILSQINYQTWETSSWPSVDQWTWLRTTDPETDYETGEETYYSMHIRPASDPRLERDHKLFAKHLRKIYLMAGLIKIDQLPWSERTSHLNRILNLEYTPRTLEDRLLRG